MAVRQLMGLRRGLLYRRQVGVSSSNPFSTGSSSGFPGSGNGGSESGSSTNTGTSSGSGSGSDIGTGTGSTSTGSSDSSGTSSSGSGSSSGSSNGSGSTSSSYPYGSGSYGEGDGSGSGSYGPSTTGLSNSAIAGIAIGSVLAFFIVVGLLVWLCTRKRRPPHEQEALAKETHAHQSGHGEETVAFAKVANASHSPNGQHDIQDIHNLHDVPDLPDDPPAYEEIGQQGNVHPGNHPLQRGHSAEIEYALGSVPDGFRQYTPQPPALDSGAKVNFDEPNGRRDHGLRTRADV
ncbi:Sperm protein associated with the nucleus on the X chromosome [Sporothrix eucalyptigena]|uniref:Sperm protein associated with the nucleus on the X chromosome n=1 Tax=Sporothrix eucalyptigena TaxID=1812306 RepID=A0ABP0CJT9_9PEZI